MKGAPNTRSKKVRGKKQKPLTSKKRFIATLHKPLSTSQPTISPQTLNLSVTTPANLRHATTSQLQSTLTTPIKTYLVSHFANAAPKSMIPSGGKKGKRPAHNPSKLNLGFAARAENALQLTQGATPTVDRTKSIGRITHLEKTVLGKVAQIEAYLSHPVESYSLTEIISIYNEFKDIRFACPLNVWLGIMHMWSRVARQVGLDQINKEKSSKVPLELLDELFQISKLGTYSVMKSKNLSIPEHMLKFNLRPNNKIFNQCLIALRQHGNHEGVLQLYDQYESLLDAIPDVQYLPSPLLPEGPEKEQELVSRRLMAQRRQELQHTAALDKQVMMSASSIQRYDKVDQIMTNLLTRRSYAPSNTTTTFYTDSLIKRGSHTTHILFFKEIFQPQIYTNEVPNPALFEQRQQKMLDQLVQSGSIIKTTTISQNNDVDEARPSYHVKHTHANLDTTLPDFLGHPDLLRQTTAPPRANWLNLFASLAALHPIPIDSADTPTPYQPDNTTASTLQLFDSKTTDQLFHLSRAYASHRDPNILVKNKQLRHHLYKIARDQYGIVIDKNFFESMILDSPIYDDTIAFLDDFHTQLDEFRVKSKQNPWNEEEIAKMEQEKKIKSLLIVDLNVKQHDYRMKEIFGRFTDEVKQLGYDGKFYTLVHKKLLSHLLESYQNDEVSSELNSMSQISNPKLRSMTGDLVDMYDIETVIDAQGQIHKIKKLKIQPTPSHDGTPSKELDSVTFGEQGGFTKQSLFDRYKTKQTEDVQSKLSFQSSISPNTPSTSNSSDSTSPDTLSLSQLPTELALAPLSKTPMVSLVERFNKEVTDMLISSTTRHKIKHILESVQTVRAFQEAYGLPVDPHVESNYFQSLLLMARRNEVYPPVLSTSDTSLIKYNVAPYIPSFDGETVGSNGKALINFKDRIQHIHTSIKRREQQLSLTLQELEHSIDSLATMKNEIDEYGRLKQINLRILNDAIEALCELSIDAAILRGPFDQSNIFYYNAPMASQVLGELASGRVVEGMKIDPNSGAKFVPGITEPHHHQIDHVDLHELKHTSLRLQTWCFGEMKHTLQQLLQLGTALTPHEAESIPLLRPDDFGSLVTENTYIPLLRVCAAHGDYQNALLLVESAHMHRNVVPTTNMLNQVAIAFMNSSRPRNAIGVLDIMSTASQPENRQVRKIQEEELRRSIIHGTAETLLETINNQLDLTILPDRSTLTLLLRMYKEQGMLDHVEELWRRLSYIDPNNWTSFSAVEEQQMVARVLGEELENTLVRQDNPLYNELKGTKKGAVPADLSLSVEDAYDKALNPAKNRHLVEALRHNEIRKNMKSLLRNRPIPSLLPKGAHDFDLSPAHKREHLQLDSVGLTIMMQTFIQLGHPMHALQLYLDTRQAMPIFPIITPAKSPQFQQAIQANHFLERQQLTNPHVANNDIDSLSDFINKQRDGDKILANALTNSYDEISQVAVPTTPVKRLLNSNREVILHSNANLTTDATGTRIESQTFYNMASLTPKMVQLEDPSAETTTTTIFIRKNALINSSSQQQLLNGGLDGNATQNPFDQIIQGTWPEVDALASLALYAYKKGEQYLAKMTAAGHSVNLPPEVHEHALLLKDSAEAVIAGLKRYTVDHPYLPGDASTLLYYSLPGTQNNAAPPEAGVQFTQPRLVLPYLVDTESIYRAVDRLVYSDIALEETVFKMRYKNLKPIGMQRWFTIFPTMINQCKAVQQSQIDRDDINTKLDSLRDDVEMLLATGRRKPKYVQVAELVQKNAISGEALTIHEVNLIQSADQERAESGSKTTINVQGLHKMTHFEDRGISHPSTHQFTDAQLPGAAEVDISEFTTTTSSWLSNFNDFLKSKKKDDIFQSIQAAKPLDADATQKLKQKILAQTKVGSETTKKPVEKETLDTSESISTAEATQNALFETQSHSSSQTANKPKFSKESMQTLRKPFNIDTFDDEITPESVKTAALLKEMTDISSQLPNVKHSGAKWGGEMTNRRAYMQEQRATEEATQSSIRIPVSTTPPSLELPPVSPTGALPMFPFLSETEQKQARDPKSFLAKLRQELNQANNNVVGFYPSTDINDQAGGDEIIQFDTDNTAASRMAIRSMLPTKNPKRQRFNGNGTNEGFDGADITFGRNSFENDMNNHDEYISNVNKYNKSVHDDKQTQNDLDSFLNSTPTKSSSVIKKSFGAKIIGDDDSNDEIAFHSSKNAMAFSSKQTHKTKNSLLLPEVQQMKQHLSDQAQAQRNIMSKYTKQQQNDVATGQLKDGTNSLTEMMSSDLTLLQSFHKGSHDNLPTSNSAVEWLTPQTDISVVSQVTKRNVQTANRFKTLPGIIDEDQIKEVDERREFIQRISHGDTQPDRKVMMVKRPGSIHSSPHGPQSHLPDNQFRSPSSMAKLANTPDNQVSLQQMGLDHDDSSTKFTVRTHGVAMADRPGHTTTISQEYLEKYIMDLGPDQRDKRSVRAHAALGDQNEAGMIMDPSFIKPGDSSHVPTQRGAKGQKSGHAEGYGQGLHKFRDRAQADVTNFAQKSRQLLLDEFESAAVPKTQLESSNIEKDFSKMTRKERSEVEYKNLFEIGGEEDEYGAEAMSKTGRYSMLSSQDRTRRDIAAKEEGFAELENQLDELFKTKEKASIGDGLATDYEFVKSHAKNDSNSRRRVKEVFSSAMQHGSKDYYGVGNKNTGGKKRPDQSTFFD